MNPESKWAEFEDPSYRIVDIGRTFVFYIPLSKLDIPSPEEERSVREFIHSFLEEHFGGGNVDSAPREGFWVNDEKKIFFDKCVRYSVSFLGKERIKELLVFLRVLLAHTGEECFYISAGQYDSLIYPVKVARLPSHEETLRARALASELMSITSEYLRRVPRNEREQKLQKKREQKMRALTNQINGLGFRVMKRIEPDMEKHEWNIELTLSPVSDPDTPR